MQEIPLKFSYLKLKCDRVRVHGQTVSAETWRERGESTCKPEREAQAITDKQAVSHMFNKIPTSISSPPSPPSPQLFWFIGT